MSASGLQPGGNQTTPFYRDIRHLTILAQILFVVVVCIVGAFFINNLVSGLRASNIPLSWSFLGQEAGFEIGEGPAFAPTDSYAQAFLVGIANTVRVALIGILLSTALGLLVGIARLSGNWLLRTLAAGYVELIRNTPLLVQLFFWYFAVILKLPDIKESGQFAGVALLSNRGIALTWPRFSATGREFVIWFLAAFLAALLVGYFYRRWRMRQGRMATGFLPGLGTLLVVMLIGLGVTLATATLPANVTYTLEQGDRGRLYVDRNGNGRYDAAVDAPVRYTTVTLVSADGVALGVTQTDGEGNFRFFGLEQAGATLTWTTPPPLVWDKPVLQGFNYRGGLQLSPEFAALLLGLTVYTAAFVAEVVRAGISAVPKGQWEASRALGLSTGDVLRLVVLPQALRIIIPPLTNQYLNLTKNSSLAIAVGYPDLFNVSRTIFNQSGATVQMFVLILLTYLSLSLLTSLFMNWYNKRVALVER